MPTTVFNAYSKAYPSIVNRIRASIYTQANPQALVASIIDVTVGHPERVYSFPGLPRNNYGFTLDEIDGSGNPVQNLAHFAAVPGQLDGALNRDDEQIKCDVTPGFISGANTFVMDGTGGKPDYIGWTIVPSELDGRGILKIGLDYSWDKVTATLILLQAGDIFASGKYYNIHFDPISNPAGNSYPTITDFTIRLLTADTILDVSDFGNKIIIEPASPYVEITFPDIDTVVEGRKLMIEVGGSGVRCVNFLANGSDPINWLRGNIYAYSGETLSVYKFTRTGVPEWRVCDAYGNFMNCGQLVSDDFISSGVFNKHLLDGLAVDKFQYARIYNNVVLQLPGTQVVDYDVWAVGNNKYLYSKANSANPANLNKFHYPDRRNLYERNNFTGKAGDFLTEMISDITGEIDLPLVQHVGSGPSAGITDGPPAVPNHLAIPFTISGGSETRPISYLINKYVLI